MRFVESTIVSPMICGAMIIKSDRHFDLSDFPKQNQELFKLPCTILLLCFHFGFFWPYFGLRGGHQCGQRFGCANDR